MQSTEDMIALMCISELAHRGKRFIFPQCGKVPKVLDGSQTSLYYKKIRSVKTKAGDLLSLVLA